MFLKVETRMERADISFFVFSLAGRTLKDTLTRQGKISFCHCFSISSHLGSFKLIWGMPNGAGENDLMQKCPLSLITGSHSSSVFSS